MPTSPRQVVLVVDDDPITLEALCALLEAKGFGVESARCADEAMILVDGDVPPDVILTDMSMPDRGGEELAAAIRMHPRCGNLPIVAMSACSRSLEHLEGKADAKLLKPFELPALLEALDRVRTARTPAR